REAAVADENRKRILIGTDVGQYCVAVRDQGAHLFDEAGEDAAAPVAPVREEIAKFVDGIRRVIEMEALGSGRHEAHHLSSVGGNADDSVTQRVPEILPVQEIDQGAPGIALG